VVSLRSVRSIKIESKYLSYIHAITCLNDVALKVEDMPYNEKLDARIKKVAAGWKNTTDKKMFGGICHLVNGNMFCGVHKDWLVLRLGEETSREAMTAKHARPFDITGKPMKGWVMVAEEGYKNDEDLQGWLEKAKKFAKTLPAK